MQQCVAFESHPQIPQRHVYSIEHRVRNLGLQIQDKLRDDSSLSPIVAWDLIEKHSSNSLKILGDGIDARVLLNDERDKWMSLDRHLVLSVHPAFQRNVSAYLFYADGDYKTVLSHQAVPPVVAHVVQRAISGR
jgi:hypothetical protein